MKIALTPNLSKKNAHAHAVCIIRRLLELHCEVFLLQKHQRDFPMEQIRFFDDIHDMMLHCDVVITIGGDGTIIHVAKYAAEAGKPILGVNLGRIGFVAGLEIDELDLLQNLIEIRRNHRK